MRPYSPRLRTLAAAIFVSCFCFPSFAQAPPSIQFFMPDGSLPPRELRFTLTTDDGRVETYFTDSKGRFLITRSEGLRPDAAYTITIQSDGRTFDTTTVSFKHYGVYYVPIFLKPLKSKIVKPAGVIDLAELDAQTPREARDAYDAAIRALKVGQADQAISGLKRSLEIYPKYFRALNDLGVLLMKLGNLDEAAETLRRAIEIAPRVYYPRLNLAIIRTKQAKYKEAIELLEPLHKENPDLVQIRIALADALMAVDRLDEARSHLLIALADDKLDRETSGDLYYKHGLLLNRKQQFDKAVKELSKAAKILPDSARIHLQLGAALLQLKRFDEAERELLAAYSLGGSEMGAAQFWLGELYFLNKEYDKAMRAFERYLADVPKAPNAAQVQEVINKIKAALKQK